jgi:hypothetical protein
MIEALLALVLFAGTLSYVVDPLLKKSDFYSRFNEDTTLRNLEQEKFNIYAQIKEADFEYEMGKLSYKDYRFQRQELMEKASEILDDIDRHLGKTDSKTPSGKDAAACAQCGTPASAGAKYCAVCGAPIVTEITCSECDEENPAGSNYCWKCGTGLVAA